MPVVIIIAVIAVFIGIAISAHLAAKKRREAFALLAARLGLRFSAEHDSSLAKHYSFLDALRTGSHRYAFNVLSGRYKESDVRVFDYHYETHSTNSKGQRRTQHHYFSFFILTLERNFPELKVGKEGFLSKVAQSIGFDDIDFESHEFSRAFCVRSKDKRFAYDVCNARMIEHLLANRDISFEIEGDALAMGFSHRLAPAQVPHNLDRLITLRSLLPNYLFEGE